MGLFGRKKEDEVELTDKNSALNPNTQQDQTSNSADSNSSLQNLMNDFRNMSEEPIEEPVGVEETSVDENLEDGVKYNTTPEENKQIENYLTGEEDPIESSEDVGDSLDDIAEDEEVIDEDGDEIIEDEEVIDEDGDEIIDDEEIIDEDGDEIIDDEEIVDEDSDEIIDDEEIIDEDGDETIDDEEIVDEDSDEIIDDEEIVDDEAEDEPAEDNKNLNNEELEFYKKLVAKYEKANKAKEKKSEKTTKKPSKKSASEKTKEKKSDTKKKTTKKSELTKKTTKKNNKKEEKDDKKEVEGITIIEDSIFRGDIVTFTPLREVKKASWEDVVRRKGHYAYHVTAADNGGWFIKRAGKPNPYAYAKRKDEVMRLAKIYAEKEKAELKIHNEKGVIEKSFSFGREKLRG